MTIQIRKIKIRIREESEEVPELSFAQLEGIAVDKLATTHQDVLTKTNQKMSGTLTKLKKLNYKEHSHMLMQPQPIMKMLQFNQEIQLQHQILHQADLTGQEHFHNSINLKT